MGNSIPAEITVFLDNSSGTPKDLTSYVLTIGDFTIEQLLEEMRPFGATWETTLPIGVGKVAPLDIGGLYNDVANGPDALFRITTPDTPATANGARTLKLQYKTTGGTKSSAVECYRQNYKTSPDRNGLSKYTATVAPTGQPTEV